MNQISFHLRPSRASFGREGGEAQQSPASACKAVIHTCPDEAPLEMTDTTSTTELCLHEVYAEY